MSEQRKLTPGERLLFDALVLDLARLAAKKIVEVALRQTRVCPRWKDRHVRGACRVPK